MCLSPFVELLFSRAKHLGICIDKEYISNKKQQKNTHTQLNDRNGVGFQEGCRGGLSSVSVHVEMLPEKLKVF